MNAARHRRGLHAHLVIRRPDDFQLDIEFSIEPGTTAALLGPNGAGKSTAVDALAGMLRLDRGSIELDGRMLDDPATGMFVAPEQRRIGVVFQDYLLFDHMTVLDNVAFGPIARGTRRAEAREVAKRWIQALGLDGFGARRPSELSGGQAQRVALARALATEPELLLLDEALAALDVATRGTLRRALAEHLEAFSGPRLLITHDPTDAFLLADYLYVIEDGRLSQSGTPDDIRRRPATTYVAALAGTNLLSGRNRAGMLELDAHSHTLQTSNTKVEGPVLITVHPTAIALHADQPHGSPRNTWQSTVDNVEPLGDTTRITLGLPLPLGVDITPASTQALGLTRGSEVWVSVKATEIVVTPTAGAVVSEIQVRR